MNVVNITVGTAVREKATVIRERMKALGKDETTKVKVGYGFVNLTQKTAELTYPETDDFTIFELNELAALMLAMRQSSMVVGHTRIRISHFSRFAKGFLSGYVSGATVGIVVVGAGWSFTRLMDKWKNR